MAIALGFDGPRIQIIEQNRFRQPEEACFEMFTRWLDKEHDLKPPTWHYLIQCLEDTGRLKDLARDLRQTIMLQKGNLYVFQDSTHARTHGQTNVRLV